MNENRKYQIVTVTEEGAVTKKRTQSDMSPEAAPTILIALELTKYHRSTPLVTLIDLVTEESADFGRQTAFCDENRTIVVTELPKSL